MFKNILSMIKATSFAINMNFTLITTKKKYIYNHFRLKKTYMWQPDSVLQTP